MFTDYQGAFKSDNKLSNSGKAIFGFTPFGNAKFGESVKPMIRPTFTAVQSNQKSANQNLPNEIYIEEADLSTFSQVAKMENLNIGNEAKIKALDEESNNNLIELVKLKKEYKSGIFKKDNEIEDMKQSLELLKNTNDDVIKEVEILTKENAKLKLESEKGLEELNAMHGQFNEVSKTFSHLGEKMKILENTLSEMKQMKIFIENERRQLKQTFNDYIENMENQFNCQQQQFSNELETKNVELDEIKSIHDQVKQKNLELSNKLKQLKSECNVKLAELTKEKEDGERENEALKEELGRLNSDVEQFMSKIESLTVLNENHREEISRLVQIEHEKDELDLLIKSLQTKYNELESEMLEMTELKELLETKVKEAELQNSELNAKIVSQEDELRLNKNKVEELNLKIVVLQQTINQLELFKQESIEKIANLEKQINQMETVTYEFNNEMEMLKTEQIRLELEKNELALVIEKLITEISECKEVNNFLSGELELAKQINVKIETSSAKLNDEYFTLAEDLKKYYFVGKRLKKEIEIKTVANQVMQSENDQLNSMLVTKNAELDAINKKYDDLDEKIKSMQKSQDAFQSIHEKLNEMIDSKENYEKTIAEKDEKIKDLKQKQDEYRDAVEKIQREKEVLYRNFQDMVTRAKALSSQGGDLSKPNDQHITSSKSGREAKSVTPTKSTILKSESKTPESILTSTRKRQLSTGGNHKRGVKTVRFEEPSKELPRFEAKRKEIDKGMDMSFIKNKLDLEKQKPSSINMLTAKGKKSGKKNSDSEVDWFDDIFA